MNESIDSGRYLTDGGLETTLIFQEGIELNNFAAFELLNNSSGIEILKQYYTSYLDIAKQRSMNFILESPTWRANLAWCEKMGYSETELKAINMRSIEVLRELRDLYKEYFEILISGNIGPLGDGYQVDSVLTAGECYDLHLPQIQAFALADVDMVTALTMTYSQEALGLVRAAEFHNVPVVVSFTVETDGNLPSGETLQSAIEQIDLETNGYVSYYMINCAHPQHFSDILKKESGWVQRIQGIRANASVASHEELDNSEELDRGDLKVLATGFAELNDSMPGLRVVGGCCGTDTAHIHAICDELFS